MRTKGVGQKFQNFANVIFDIRTRQHKKRRSKSNLPEDIRQEERELERRLEERVRKKRGSKGAAKRDHEHHFNDPVLISVLNGLQGLRL